MKTIIQIDGEPSKQKPQVRGDRGAVLHKGFVALPVMITIATSMLFGGALMSKTNSAEAEVVAQTKEVTLSSEDNEELLWFARVLYSETKRADEQELVAWVVRNRVEHGYWGDTYKEVILAKGQFSGMHPTDANYEINVQKGDHSNDVAWKTAVAIAEEVYFADSKDRPFPSTVRHFYSPISVVRHPSWAQKLEPVLEISDDNSAGVRFAFYAGVQ